MIRSRYASEMECIDLKGRIVLPGLTDAHIHLEKYALGLRKVDCETDTIQECLRRVAERRRSASTAEWVLGHGWNQNVWQDGFGTAADLDKVSPGNPVYLTAKSLHAAWANTVALRLANITATTPDPADGKLGRNADGSPNGILYEGAMELVANVIPAPTSEQLSAAILEAQKSLWQMGITGVHDFDRRRCFVVLQDLRERDKLRLRVLKSIPLEDLPSAVSLGLRSGFGDEWVRIGGVKIFMDGALGPQTAAMIHPYDGYPESRGMLFMDSEELLEHGKTAVESRISLAVHAIGDRANHELLDAFAQLREYEQQINLSQKPALRHRIEHVQLLHPDDVGRLAQLGVIASMQPIHATSDMLMADRFWGDRSRYAYAWQLQLQHGATLAFGSDAPVESPNPFWGIHAAVTRRRIDGSPGVDGWYPQERISLMDALRAYTIGPAFGAGWEHDLGKLANGCLADLIILENDPFEIPVEELHNLRPCGVMVNGEWVVDF